MKKLFLLLISLIFTFSLQAQQTDWKKYDLKGKVKQVKALPENLPDFVPVDISWMEMGNRLYITKIAQEKYKIMHPDNTVVCQVRVSRAALKAAQEAAKADGKKKK